MKGVRFLSLAAVALLALCCGTSVKSAGKAGDEKRQIFVLLDRGISEEMIEGQAKERREVGDLLETDLLRALEEEDLAPSLVKSREEYSPKPETFFLSVVLKNYVPANKTSRLAAGFGEGVVTIEVRYELIRGKSKRAALTSDDGVTSAMGSERAVKDINEKIADVVADRIDEMF